MVAILPGTPTAIAMISLVESPPLDAWALLLCVVEAVLDPFGVCFVPEPEVRAEEPSTVEESEGELAAAAVRVVNALASVPSTLKSYPPQFFFAHSTAVGKSDFSQVLSTQVRYVSLAGGWQ